MSRRTPRPMILVVTLALAVAGLIASSAVAGKPSSASLDVSFPTLASASTTTSTSVPYNTPYVVSGCGYGTTVGVTVVVHTPEAISFAGQMPNAEGCISLSNFSSQGAGHYQVDAYQELRNKSSRVATMSFDLS
jgi:hypothetical protein